MPDMTADEAIDIIEEAVRWERIASSNTASFDDPEPAMAAIREAFAIADRARTELARLEAEDAPREAVLRDKYSDWDDRCAAIELLRHNRKTRSTLKGIIDGEGDE